MAVYDMLEIRCRTLKARGGGGGGVLLAALCDDSFMFSFRLSLVGREDIGGERVWSRRRGERVSHPFTGVWDLVQKTGLKPGNLNSASGWNGLCVCACGGGWKSLSLIYLDRDGLFLYPPLE